MNLINKDFDNKKYYFYKLPKKIFKKPYSNLSANAKLCYMLLLDRINLSLYNNITDKENNVFIFYSREDMENDLHISKATCIKVFKELVAYHLIKQVQDSIGYRIYLYDIFDDLTTSSEKT